MTEEGYAKVQIVLAIFGLFCSVVSLIALLA